jgi:hypothetical protein
MTDVDQPDSLRRRIFAIRPDGRSSLTLRVAMAAIVGLCLYGIIWAFGVAQTDPAVKLPAQIEALNPVQDAQTVPGQATVTVDFVFGITGELNIDGVDIPADETVYEKSQAMLSFSPGVGRALKLLPGGLRRATVYYWPVSATRETAGRAFSWTFTVT